MDPELLEIFLEEAKELLEALAQLAPGDHLVHEHHGIGIYRGLVKLELRGIEGEFLRIQSAMKN